MSTKNNKKKNTASLEGSLKKLIKQYEGTTITSQIESNLAGSNLVSFPTKTTPTIKLFKAEYFNPEINIEDKTDQIFPIYLYLEDKKPVIFSGWNEYLKILRKGQTEFKGYLLKNITSVEAIFFFLQEMKKNKDNPLILSYAYKVLKDHYNVSYSTLSDILQISKSQIINMVHLLTLPPTIIEAILDHRLTYALARPLNGLSTSKQKIEIFNKIIENKLSAHDIEKLVSEYKYPNQKYLNKIYVDGNKITIKCKSHEEAKELSAKIKESDLF